jgi:hypothetical protein
VLRARIFQRAGRNRLVKRLDLTQRYMALADRSNARAYPSKAASAAASEQTFGVSADFFAQWQEFDGELIVVDSRDPEHDLARALLARGLTGKVTMLDAQTGKPRTVVDIAKAAELCVSEESRDRLRIQATARARIVTHRQPKTILSSPPYPRRRTRLLDLSAAVTRCKLALLGFSLRWAHLLDGLCQIFDFCWVRLRKGRGYQLIRLSEELLGSPIHFSRNLGR